MSCFVGRNTACMEWTSLPFAGIPYNLHGTCHPFFFLAILVSFKGYLPLMYEILEKEKKKLTKKLNKLCSLEGLLFGFFWCRGLQEMPLMYVIKWECILCLSETAYRVLKEIIVSHKYRQEYEEGRNEKLQSIDWREIKLSWSSYWRLMKLFVFSILVVHVLVL